MVIMARKEITYTPSAEVCSKEIHIVLEDDVIVEVGFKKGCAGNTQGVSALLKGMKEQNGHPSVAGNMLRTKVNFMSRSVGSSLGEYGVI